MVDWQWIVIAVVALASLGRMAAAVVGLFSRRAEATAVVREATAAESALVGSIFPEGARAFDAWSYRVGARFAGRVRVVVYEETIAVAGPRVPRGLYRVWIWVQAIVLATIPPVLAAALVYLDWRWLVTAVGLFFLNWLISAGGAGLWPGLGELPSVETGHFTALEFPLRFVRDVSVGKGWSAGGLDVVLLPYRPMVDKMAARRAVSFFGPDETTHEVRFALHMTSEAAAQELVELTHALNVASSPSSERLRS